MASIKRKQYKNTYKIPRSLKDSIKQNLNKIVKRRERKIRADERKKINIDIETRIFEAHNYCTALDKLIQNFDMSRELAHALDALLFRHWDNANDAVERQRAAMKGKKAFARHVLSKGYLTQEIKEDMMMWKGEEETGEEVDGVEDKEHDSRIVDEEGWSSTSTLA